MAEQIGIRLNLQGASQVQGGLQGVVRSLGELDSKTLKVGDAFKALGPQLAAALSLGTIAAWARATINAVDAMNDLADATGASVEEISKLDGLARRTGTTLDSVGGIMLKFNAALNAAGGADNPTSLALRAIGVDTQALRRADPVDALQQTARALSRFADDANKARIVQELFGKSIREAAPFLKDLAEAGTLQATVTRKQAEEAERFNRALNTFTANAGDVGRAIVNAMLPGLNDLLQRINAVRESFGGLMEFLRAQPLLGGAGIYEFKDPAQGYEAYSKRIAEIDAKIADQRVRRSAYEMQALQQQRQELERYQAFYASLARAQGGFGPGAGRGAPPTSPLPTLPDISGGREVPPAIRDPRAQYRADFLRSEKAAYAELERERERQAEEARKRDASYAEYQLQLQDDVTRTLMQLQQDEAQFMREYDADQRKRLDSYVEYQMGLSEQATQDLIDLQDYEARYMREYDAEKRRRDAAYSEWEMQQQEYVTRALMQDRDDEARYMQAWDEEQRRREASYAAYVVQLSEEGTQAIMDLREFEAAYMKQWDADAREREAAAAEYRMRLQDDITKALMDDAAAVQKYLDDQTEAARRNLESIQARTADLKLDAKASALAAAQAISLAEAIELVTIARLREQQAMYRAGTEGYNAIEREIQAREKLLGALGDQRVRQANDQAAKDAAAQWERTVDQVGQSLADALMSGGKSAGDALKRYFSTLVLQPIIKAIVDPVARVIVGSLGLAGTAAASTGGGAGGLSILSGVNSISSLFGAVSGSAASSLGGLIGGFGNAIGSTSLGLFGSGMQGASLAAGLAGPTTAGAGGAMGAGAAFATALPWLAAAGALAALWQPLFGRKLKDTGIEGFLTGSGFDGSQYSFYKGGLFRSDKTTRQGVQPELEAFLDTSLTTLRDSTMQMARDMGLAADAVNGFSRQIKISFMGLTEEQIQQRLAQELGSVADEMARLAGGAGMTASSLRQLYERVMAERAQLEERLLQLQGDTAELRRREREAIHESNRALYDRIIALQDEQARFEQLRQTAQAAAQELQQQISALQGELAQAESQRLSIAQQVISERITLEDRLLQAQGRTAELQARQLATLDPLNRAFARFVLAAEASAQRLQALAQAGQGIAAFVDQLRGGAAGGSARSIYASTLARAQAGDVEASGQITGAAQAYLDAATATARSSAEARVLRARVASELEGLPATQSWQAQQAEALRQIAANTAAGSQLVDLLIATTRAGFSQLDTTADGLLTASELSIGLRGLATDAQIAALLRTVDLNGDGQISELELLRAVTGDVADSSADALTENERQVAELRKLVAETVVNSTRLSTLNASIQSLTNAIAAANEAQRVQQEIAIRQNEGQAALSNFNKLTSAYSQPYAAAQQQFVQTFLKSFDPYFTAVRMDQGQPDFWNVKNATKDRFGSYFGDLYEREQQIQRAADAGNFAEAVRLINAQQLGPVGSPLNFNLATPDQVAQGNLKSSFVALTGPASEAANAALRYLESVKAAQSDLEALRQQIRNLGGVPQFAMGGLHSGGLRIVGERGPELEATGPARYWSAADTTAMLSNGQRREELLAAEIRALRAEVAGLRTEARVTAVATNKTQRLWERVTRDGESMQIVDVTPTP
jgi:hypothetical protein